MINLKNKSVFITGGSRGIGAACVKLYKKAGADVYFTYNKVNSIINSDLSSFAKSYQLDLCDSSGLEQKMNNILNEINNIDILVLNAGIWEFGEADKMTLEEWERTLKINLTSAFIITKAVIPIMKKNKNGKIIFISSTAGQRGEAFHSHYAASKGAVISFTKSLASELAGFNINVNCVAPGWVLSDMTKDALSDKLFYEKVKNEIPLNRVADPDDIAGPVIFLSSDLARHVNGEILNVNGGSLLCG